MIFGKEKVKLYIVAFFVAAVVLIWYVVFSEERNLLAVNFLNVGQGDAIFIQSPDGKQILIDGGSGQRVLGELSRVMPFYDRSIDALILTHPDKDHLEGLVSVLRNYKVENILESGAISVSPEYAEFEKLITDKSIKKIFVKNGDTIYFDKKRKNSFYLKILYPFFGVDISDLETNSASIVAKLVYGENSFLFTGDLPKNLEKYLAGNLKQDLDVDVLKLGHHGSKTSNSEELLGFSSPEYTVASVGKNNSYGHPHQEVLTLLKKFNIPLLRTDDLGTIMFTSDGASLKVK